MPHVSANAALAAYTLAVTKHETKVQAVFESQMMGLGVHGHKSSMLVLHSV